MKKALTIICFLITFLASAQKAYTVNDETLVLNKEVDGPVKFLWNSINGQFRYFIQTDDDNIIELVNTKGGDNTYNEEYKDVIYEITGMNPADVKLTTYSIKSIIREYNYNQTVGDSSNTSSTNSKKGNSKKNSNSGFSDNIERLQWRLGGSAGFTNHPYVSNPEAVVTPTLNIELEASEQNYPRHAGFLGFDYNASSNNNEFTYLSLQISLGYRWRFVNTESVNFHTNVRFATFTYSENKIFDDTDDETVDDSGVSKTISITDRNRTFTVPLSFGIGSDIRVRDNGSITILIDSLFALFLKNKNEKFPLDVSIGYRMDL